MQTISNNLLLVICCCAFVGVWHGICVETLCDHFAKQKHRTKVVKALMFLSYLYALCLIILGIVMMALQEWQLFYFPILVAILLIFRLREKQKKLRAR